MLQRGRALTGSRARRAHSHSGTGGWLEVFRHEDDAAKTLSADLGMRLDHIEDDWRSALHVGSVVEVLARAGAGLKRQWVRADIIIARQRTLTLKWFGNDG